MLANIALRVDKFSDSAVNGLNCVWLVLSGSCHLRLPFLGERLCVMAVPSSKTVDAANSNFLRAYKHYSTSSGIWWHTFRQLAQVSGIVQAPVIDTFFVICFIPTSECACVPGDRAWQHARRVNENNLVFINSDTSFIQKSPRNYSPRKPVGTSFAIISSFELSFTFPFLSAFRWNKNEAEQFHFCFRSVATFF